MAIKNMVLFGIPPEEYYPYDITKFDDEPSAFSYAFAQNYQTIHYYRLDRTNVSSTKLLERVKFFLAAGYSSMFGFTVYNFGNDKGEFEFPGPGDAVQGGHAVVAVGYDDNRKIGKDKRLKSVIPGARPGVKGVMTGFPMPMWRRGSLMIYGAFSKPNMYLRVNLSNSQNSTKTRHVNIRCQILICDSLYAFCLLSGRKVRKKL